MKIRGSGNGEGDLLGLLVAGAAKRLWLNYRFDHVRRSGDGHSGLRLGDEAKHQWEVAGYVLGGGVAVIAETAHVGHGFEAVAVIVFMQVRERQTGVHQGAYDFGDAPDEFDAGIRIAEVLQRLAAGCRSRPWSR